MLGGIKPWISMWSEPRSTIRAIVSTNPRFGIVYLSAIYFLQNFFYFFSRLSVTDSTYLVLFLGILVSPLLGMVWLYSTGFVFYWTGRLLGGTAPLSHLMAAIAWSKIPLSISLFMWFVLLVSSQEVELLYYPEGQTSFFIALIALMLTVWSFVLLVQSIREVQKFSLQRVFINIAVVWAIFSVLFSLVLILRF